jgi:hypothetical protein
MRTRTHTHTLSFSLSLCKFVYMLNTTNMEGVTTFKVNLKTCELIFWHQTLFLLLTDTAFDSHLYDSSIEFYANLDTDYHSFPSS